MAKHRIERLAVRESFGLFLNRLEERLHETFDSVELRDYDPKGLWSVWDCSGRSGRSQLRFTLDLNSGSARWIQDPTRGQ